MMTMMSRLAYCRLGLVATAHGDSRRLLTDRRWSSRLLATVLAHGPNNSNNNKNTTHLSRNKRSITVARLCLPDDANVAGNVHGGTILRLMEEAGMITATRHMAVAGATANGVDSPTINAVGTLVRFENMSFHQPLYVGEVASLTARPIFTSEHSILVQVVVTGENLVTGKTRVTNTGELWYVPLLERKQGGHEKSIVVQVPPINPPDVNDEMAVQEYERAKLSYETRKRMKECSNDVLDTSFGTITTSSSSIGMDDFQKRFIDSAPSDPNARTPRESEQTLCQVVQPSDCAKNRIAFGGFVMKLMDNAAGCSAYRHCRTNVVTVAISSIDFINPVQLGEICTIHSKAVFSSSKTLEMQVQASVTCARRSRSRSNMAAARDGDDDDDTVVAFGRFTFASLDKNGKAIPVPPLRLETKEDMERAFQGQQRYMAAKQARAGAQQDAAVGA